MLNRQAIERAAGLLNRGEVIVLPTDTVPGLFALDTPQGETRLMKLKGRSEARPFARMFGSRAQLESRIEIKTRLQELAVNRLLPGRVTLILPDAKSESGSLGVRLPMDASLRALIRQTGPLIATSANISGEESNAKELPGRLLEGAAMVIRDNSSAASRLTLSSTVIDLVGPRPVILRKGAVSVWTAARRLGIAPYLKEPQELNVLFVCGGNTCRSPMASAFFQNNCGVERINVKSAGLSATQGSPATIHARNVLHEFKLTLTNHTSTEVSAELLSWADLLLTMTREHLLKIRREYPQFSDRSFLLSGFPEPWPHGQDIEDPLGSGIETYREVALRIQSYTGFVCATISKALKRLD